jgi:rhomboid protease GluP
VQADFMGQQVTFGRKGLAVKFPLAPPVSRAAAIEGDPQPAEPSYSDLSGQARLLAAVPMLTIAMTLLLAIIFALQQQFAFDISPDGVLSLDTLVAQGADSRDLTLGDWQLWRLALAPLLHASSGHLLGNLLAFVLVGIMLEPMIGRGWFLAIFALSGLGGEILSISFNPPWVPGVGASGAITGLLSAGFVLSFSADTPEEGARLRRRALFFGVPALAPLLWGAQDEVNYYAHLGGALTGAAIAFAVDQTWDRVDFRPAFHRQAAIFGAALLALSLPAAAFAAVQYGPRREAAARFIPSSELNASLLKLAARADAFQRRYPDDPMTRIIAAVHDASDGRAAEGEGALRAAMAMRVPARPWAERPLHATARGFLSLLLKLEGRRQEAQRLAAPVCAGHENHKMALVLRKNQLCAPG